MLSVRTKVNSMLSQKLKKDIDAPYYGKPLNFSAGSSNTPSSFPTLDVSSLGEPSTEDDLDGGSQNAIISTIELKAYTDTSRNDAYTLINHAGDVMLGMGYKLIYGATANGGSNPYCIIARFRRTFGSEDKL